MIQKDFNAPPKKDEIHFPIFHLYRYYVVRGGFASPRQIKRDNRVSGWWIKAYDAFRFKTKKGQWVSK